MRLHTGSRLIISLGVVAMASVFRSLQFSQRGIKNSVRSVPSLWNTTNVHYKNIGVY